MSNAQSVSDIWRLVREDFDEKLPRRTAVLVKEDDFSLPFAYPCEFGSIGWLLDNRDKATGYDEPPTASMKFGEYSFPDLTGKRLARNAFYFGKMEYFPSLVKREIIFSNIGVEAAESFAQGPQGGFIWKLDLTCRNHPCYAFEKRFYAVVSFDNTDTQVQYHPSEKVFEIKLDGKELFIASNFDNFGLYETIDSYLDDVKRGVLSNRTGRGKQLVLEYNVRLEHQETKRIALGISFLSSAKAVAALKERDFEEKIREKWNGWFSTLPAVDFESETDRKAYYKCWWVVRLNYYEHPRWGRTVLESLPVYRGYWQWALPAAEWHCDLDPETGPSSVKALLDMFLNYQRADGYVTHAVYLDEEVPGQRWSDGWGEEGSIIQTPHIPWVALRYYHAAGDVESLRSWYPKLTEYYRYLNESRDDKFLKLHLWAITTSFDTGLDTTAAFQKVTYGEAGNKEKFCYPAIFAAEKCRYEQAMAKMAELLGNKQKADQYRRQSQLTREAMDRVLWDEKKNWYGVLHEDGSLDTRVGIDGLFPLAYGLVDEQKARLAKENFLKLLGDYGVFTVAPDEAGFHEETYWRGPAWSKSCSMALAAAANYYPDLLGRVKDGLVRFLLKHPSVWECMSARTGKIGRADMGLMAAPVMSSNVGAGEAIGALLTYYGRDMFSF